MALSAVRIRVAVPLSLEALGGVRNSGFMDVQPNCTVVVKVKELLFPEKVMVTPASVSRVQKAGSAEEI